MQRQKNLDALCRIKARKSFLEALDKFKKDFRGIRHEEMEYVRGKVEVEKIDEDLCSFFLYDACRSTVDPEMIHKFANEKIPLDLFNDIFMVYVEEGRSEVEAAVLDICVKYGKMSPVSMIRILKLMKSAVHGQ
jgi:hypothetical protein